MRNAAIFLLAAAICGGSAVAVAAQPSPVPAYTAADALFAKGAFAAAAVEFERVLRANPSDVDANIGTAQLCLYRADDVCAMRHARAAEAADAGNLQAAKLLAQIVRHDRDLSTIDQVEFHTPNVVVPFVATDPLPTLMVSMDGHDARMILDTGGPGLTVSADFAAKAGISATASREAIFAGNQTTTVHTGGSVHTLVIGSATVRNIPADIAPMPDPSIDGVIGTGLLAHFIATIDYRRGRLVLHPRSDSRTLQREAAAAGDTIVPMYVVADHFIFTDASVNGSPPALFNIDTGGPMIGIDLSPASLQAAGIVPDPAHAVVLAGGGGPVRALTFTATSVSLGSTTVLDVPGITVPGSETRNAFPFAVAGRLSHQFFRYTRLTLDFAAMRLVVSTR